MKTAGAKSRTMFLSVVTTSPHRSDLPAMVLWGACSTVLVAVPSVAYQGPVFGSLTFLWGLSPAPKGLNCQSR